MKISSLNIKSLLSILFICIVVPSFSQEICGNGIDDDNDGIVDCYDSECFNHVDCDGFYYGGVDPTCAVNYLFNPNFGLNKVWESTEDINGNIPLIAGDIDGDGIPEVISPRKSGNQIYILDGQTGQTEAFIAQTLNPASQGGGLLNCDGIGGAELFFVNANGLLYGYKGNGIGIGSYQTILTGYIANHDVWNPQFADFNQDGKGEIYIGNQIFNAANGAKLTEAGSEASRGTSDGDGSSVIEELNNTFAADVLPDAHCDDCSGLELIAGNEVYSVKEDGGNWTLNLESSIKAQGNYRDGKVSIADWDADGKLDIICSSSVDDNEALIYIWNPRTETIIGNSADGGSLVNNPFNPNSLLTNSFSSSKLSVLTVADIDGDGYPEIGGSGEDVVFVLNNDLTELWSKSVNNGAGLNSVVAFDFEGDGAVEVVYQTLDSLLILNGANGSRVESVLCEGDGNNGLRKPIILDVTADGRANLVCNCDDKVNVFNSITNDWRPTKAFWNQYSFNPGSVNDNLETYSHQQNPTKISGHDVFLSPVAYMGTGGNLLWLAENCDSVRLIVADGEVNNDWYPEYNEVENAECEGVSEAQDGLGLTYPQNESQVSFRAYSATGVGDLTSLDFSIQSIDYNQDFRVQVLDTANEVMIDTVFNITTANDTVSADLSDYQNSDDLVGEIRMVGDNNAEFCVDYIKFTNTEESVWTRDVKLDDVKFSVTTEGILIQATKEITGFELFDLSGKVVLKGDLNGTSAQIATAGVSEGIYVLKVLRKDVQATQVKVALK